MLSEDHQLPEFQSLINKQTDKLNPDDSFDVGLFFELSPDLLIIAGYDGYFRLINPAVSKILGFSKEELLSRPIIEFIHPDDRELTLKYREQLKKSFPLFNYENRYLTKDGEVVWFAWTSMPQATHKLIYAVAKDITHKKKLEEERAILVSNLTRINEELKHLTYTTSHDLRSPVNNLLSVLSLIDRSIITDEETLTYLNIIQDTGLGLKESLNQSIDYLDQHHSIDSKIEDVELSETLAYVKKSISTLLTNSNTSFDIDFSAFQKISFSSSHMESILLNLITNSIKYSRPEVFPHISIKTTIEGEKKKLIFSDNGLGLDMEKVQDKIFGLNQKFHTHADSKGIGLYLVKSHVVSMGAEISVQSKINAGTTFIITFKN